MYSLPTQDNDPYMTAPPLQNLQFSEKYPLLYVFNFMHGYKAKTPMFWTQC